MRRFLQCGQSRRSVGAGAEFPIALGPHTFAPSAALGMGGRRSGVASFEIQVSAHEASGTLRAAPAASRANGRAPWRAPVWVVPLFALASALLVPWVVLLVVDLPSTHRSVHWDIAWAGFDVMLVLLLLAVTVSAWRRSPWLEGAATEASTLLFIDCWFDVLTSSTQTELVVALVEAVFVELPLALVCLLLARAAERHLARDGARASTPPRLSLVRARPKLGSSSSVARRTA